jgi:hypothetical protein
MALEDCAKSVKWSINYLHSLSYTEGWLMSLNNAADTTILQNVNDRLGDDEQFATPL